MLLTNEEIKRCIEAFKPESFPTVKYNSGYLQVKLPHKEHLIDIEEFLLYIDKWDYKLFLQEVIEGINKQYLDKQIDYWIEMNSSQISCHCDYHGYALFENYKVFRTAKEQAIRYILERTNEVK